MNLTLFVDASFHPKTKAAGWGSWAIRDDWRHGLQLGGPIQYRDGQPESSNAAELAGIALALWEHEKRGHFENVTRILLQCDNVVALALILAHVPGTSVVRTNKARIGSTSFKDEKTPDVLATIKGVVKKRKLTLKHVKGHTSNKGGRYWVNSACDAEARKHMVEMRKVIETSCLTN